MTVDEVAAQVGIAKASLYKHFPSKEDLAAAAMVRVMRRAQTYLAELPESLPPLDKLRAVVRWTMELKLAGEMPSLPSQNSSLRANLMANADYMNGLIEVSDHLGAWIEAAQEQGLLNPQLPAIAVLYTLYARACDPVLEFLQTVPEAERPKVIMITANKQLQMGVEAMKAGAFDYITKPFKVDELQIAIERALDRHREQREIRSLRQMVRDRYSFEITSW
jgi:AcrR family transcriptional regulator